ncbi:MAG TPA: hypothetical protein P5556_03645 [Candidatus Gastranaerophilales bacterium]|nr:hypothetical protein [Candidatus Gastranaerophilales bacterium]
MILQFKKQNYNFYSPAKTIKTHPSFGSETFREPFGFKAIDKGILYKGGFLQYPEELEYLRHEAGIKSILSLIPPEFPQITKEIFMINNSNEKYKLQKPIIFSYFPCCERDGELYIDEENFIKNINKLPKPIYMHCHGGIALSENMGAVYKKLLREGKINLTEQ